MDPLPIIKRNNFYKHESIVIISLFTSKISCLIGYLILAYESYPFFHREPDMNLVVGYFFAFHTLSLCSPLVLALCRILDVPKTTLIKCARYLIGITTITTIWMLNPAILKHRNSRISIFSEYIHSSKFLWISLPLFLLNNAFATWYLWKVAGAKGAYEKSIDDYIDSKYRPYAPNYGKKRKRR